MSGSAAPSSASGRRPRFPVLRGFRVDDERVAGPALAEQPQQLPAVERDAALGRGPGRRGDVQDVDEDIEHRPMVGKDECICLIATVHPARFKSLIGKIMQPWTGL